MREIKLKVFDTNECVMCNDANHLSPDWFASHPNLVPLLYIGLKDKKRTKEYPEGQEIYEGDIVEVGNGYIGDSYESGRDCIIKWVDGESGFAVFDGNEYFCEIFEAHQNRGILVIGNIYVITSQTLI